MTDSSSSRRGFLGRFGSSESPAESEALVPTSGSTVHVATRAMACEFSVIMNPGPHEQISAVGEILNLIADIETWLSVYRPNSEISRVNARAASEPVKTQVPLFNLLTTARDLFEQTGGAFDIAAGAQIQLWKRCRAKNRVPTVEEINESLESSGSQHLQLDPESHSVSFDVNGLQLDPGAIGKGYALDEAAEWLQKIEDGPHDFLVHGGHSSLVARGQHENQGGWPVGIGNPLFTKKRLGTVLLKDKAMSTSGSNIQFFRHEGRRYGHILDPRTATPVEGMLSVTVFADSAAVADALSTAFFVLGVENAQKCCDNLPSVGAILMPFPSRGARVHPIVINVPEDQIFWDEQQVEFPQA